MVPALPRRIGAVIFLVLLVLVAAAAGARAAVYVALGDSYSSGVGTRDYSLDGHCKRSPFAYPAVVAHTRGDIDLRFVACGGATTDDVLAGQVAAVNGAASYVTISIGGNDAGFVSVVRQCAKPWPTTCWGDIDKARAFIRNELPGRLDRVYADINGRAPGATRLAVGYPRIFNGHECGGAARISPGEQRELNDTADLLADVTHAAADRARFVFVDPRGEFTGHVVCDRDAWLNGLSSPTSESYHPNRDGHFHYTDLVRRVIG